MTKAANQDEPPPARLRWTKWLLLGYLALAAALVVSHITWQKIADRRLAEAIAPFKALGVNLDWQTNGPPDIPASENGAALYTQAFKAIKLTGKQKALVDYAVNDPNLCGRYGGDVEELLRANQPVFDLCHRARGLEVNWGIQHISPAISTLLPYLGQNRQLMRLLCMQAQQLATNGDSAGAVDTCLDGMALARATGHDMFIIGYLVRIAVMQLLDEAVNDISPQLGDVPGGKIKEMTGISPKQALDSQQLISQLLDEDANELRNAWCMELSMFMDAADSFLDKNNPVGAGTFGCCPWLFRPAFTADKAVAAREYSVWMEMSLHRGLKKNQLPNAYQGGTTPIIAQLSRNRLAGAVHYLLLVLYPSFERVGDLLASSVAHNRMAAVRLALRLFELEHGRAATSLKELVPDYLPAVPVDPWDPNGGPLKALLTEPHAYIYSTGESSPAGDLCVSQPR